MRSDTNAWGQPGGLTRSSQWSAGTGRSWSARDVARLGMLLALASALHIFEAQLPALPIPGAKIGLANVVSLLMLYTWGVKDALWLTVLRQIVGSFMTGTLFAPPFFFGLFGGVASVLVMALFLFVGRQYVSPVAVSLFGAAFHNIGQLMAAWVLLGQVQIFYYLPYLLWFAVPSGALVGAVTQRLLPLVPAMLPTSPVRFQPRTTPAARRSTWISATTIAVVGVVLITGVLKPQNTVMANPHAQIKAGHEVLAMLPLHVDQQKEIIVPQGRFVVQTVGGRVRIAESTCDNQVCVRTGFIDFTYQSIVCLPFHVMITIVSPDETEPELDGWIH